MTVLVTGGAGYIGSHMVHALADRGERVVVLDNLSTGFRKAIPDSVPLYVGDAGDQALAGSLLRKYSVRAVIHFAGSIVVPESVANPLKYYLNNTGNSRSLIAAAVEAGVENFIFSSTAAVYGNPASVPVSEDAPTAPVSPYGWSKLMTEVMLRDTGHAHGLRAVVLRYFNVAGADPKLRTGQSTPQATHLIKLAAQTALGLRPQLQLFGTDYPTRDGTCIRDYIHVSDLARAHCAALDYLRSGGSSATFNCGYGHGFTVREVIDAIERVSGRTLTVEVCGRRDGDPMSLVADVRHIRSTLDWTPAYDDLDTIVAHALAWELRLASGDGPKTAESSTAAA
ncbi:MAG TPA: UDP-glucose 4-epimerase GalE [Pseudolabrys sp.]|nr:UDP-glucose 4-epimerase GalE [Pseudolabrys sp.]